jgi:hypothetical protein
MGKRLLLIVIGIAVAGVVGFVLYSQTPENRAKSVVNERLNSLKTGKSNPYNTFDVSTVRESFINALNYKYLTVLEKGKTPHTLSYDREFYKNANPKETYEEFIEYYKRLYVKDIENGKAKMVGDTLEVYFERDYLKLLYDLECTNRLDQRLHKEVVFTVEKDSQNHYKIVDIRDR